MKYKAFAFSVKGIREKNEDSVIVATKINKLASPFTEISLDGEVKKAPLFFAVADGMGGQGSGEKASNFVVKNLLEYSKSVNEITQNSLEEIINKIHQEILETHTKMGATLSGIILQNGQCGIVNLGDSRTYRLRDSMLLQMTNDDSLKRFVETAASNIITNGIGAGLKNISVNSRFSDKMIIPGDKFLCSCDGVHGFLSPERIQELLSSTQNAKESATKIVQESIANGSDDNCSAVVVQFEK